MTPRLVTLCGSTRFMADFLREAERLTLEGWVVLMPGVFAHATGTAITEDQKVELDRLHLEKIDLSQRVHVVNVGGYVGDSTRREVAHAHATGKPVTTLEPVADHD